MRYVYRKPLDVYISRDSSFYGIVGGGFAVLCFNNGWMFWVGSAVSVVAGYFVDSGELNWRWFLFAAASCIALEIVIRVESSPAYTGQVSGGRQFDSGAAYDLDGEYPNQKMTVFIPRAVESMFKFLPSIGDQVEVYGSRSNYKGHPEIIIKEPSDFLVVPFASSS